MAISIEEMALDYKGSTLVGQAYGFDLYEVDDSDFTFSKGRGSSGKVKQTQS